MSAWDSGELAPGSLYCALLQGPENGLWRDAQQTACSPREQDFDGLSRDRKQISATLRRQDAPVVTFCRRDSCPTHRQEIWKRVAAARRERRSPKREQILDTAQPSGASHPQTKAWEASQTRQEWQWPVVEQQATDWRRGGVMPSPRSSYQMLLLKEFN